MLKIDFYRYF